MQGFSVLIRKFLKWRARNIDQRRFLYILSFVTGMLSALAAVLLKNAIHYTEQLLTLWFRNDSAGYLYLAYPLAGMFLAVIFVRYIVRDDINHGVSKILYSISKNNSRIRPHNNWSSMVASTFTIGFGGSVGAEAPVVLTGASIGSSIGRLMKMNYRNITLLVACGAAGAVAGIFKAPIAGIVFTLEILMLDLTISSIVPLLISSVTAATVAYFLMGKDVLFTFALNESFSLGNIPWYILLGIGTALLSVYFTRATMYIESRYEKVKNKYIRLLSGGMVLGILILLLPPLYGEGYNTISHLINGDISSLFENSFFGGMSNRAWVLLVFLLALVLFKVVASSSTNGAGGVGGIFAPSLFIGGVSGFFMSRLLNTVGDYSLPESSFTLAGMAGAMAGIMHAPLTAIFLIAEITGGYGLLVPLIITSTISYISVMRFEKHSLYHKRLARRGELITHHKDRAVLTRMDWTKEIETDLITVGSGDTLGDLVKAISASKRNIFPVVDETGVLEGVVLLDDVRDIMFDTGIYDDTLVSDLMVMPPSYIDKSEKVDSVMETFNKTGAWNLPVLDGGRYVGFLSKSRIFSTYRDLLMEVSED
ncbi:MAG: chloride channel protein [Bacteroidales bacterium]|jgi:CIC family chloride channel protein|nr:chloride channel protein [Bacteroidales bacterium]